MANITLLTSTKYSIVSITASTQTIVVSGDASAQITGGRRFRLAGTASDDGFYTVVTSVYSSPNTTIVCTEELSDDGVAVGTADLQRVLGTDADWVGGVAPGVSDVGIIPSNGNLDASGNSGPLTCESGGTVTLDASNNNGLLTCESGGTVTLDNGSYNNGSLTCESGGTVTLDNGSGNYGLLTCESGGTVTLDASNNNGSLTCESGGTVTLDASYNNGSLTCESGGTVTLDNSSYNSGSLTCESGGTVTLDNSSGNYGSLTCFLYGTVTGATPIQLTIEKRTLHYTAGQSTDTLPLANGGKITLYDSVVVLGLLSPQVSPASIQAVQAVASYKQNPYILIP